MAFGLDRVKVLAPQHPEWRDKEPFASLLRAGTGARLMLLVHHTDAEREWAYDRQSPIGRLDKALDEATKNGWTVVSMKDDWKRVFAFQK